MEKWRPVHFRLVVWCGYDRDAGNSICQFGARVLSSYFVVYPAHGDWLTRGVSLLVRHSMGVTVDLVPGYVREGCFVVGNIAEKKLFFAQPSGE